jgi:hypothetical protein
LEGGCYPCSIFKVVFRPSPDGRIPVTAGPRLVEMAGPQRVQALLRAPNVRPVLRRKRAIVELQILGYGDDWNVPFKWGNPQKLSTCLEAEDNPRGVWKLKRLVNGIK